MKRRLIRVLSILGIIIVSIMGVEIYAENDSTYLQSTPCVSYDIVDENSSLDCTSKRIDSLEVKNTENFKDLNVINDVNNENINENVTVEDNIYYKVIKVNGVLRITDENGTNFYKGFYEIDGKRYFADDNAVVVTDRFFVTGGKAYIASENGELLYGIVYDSPYYYYCDPTNGGAIKTSEGIVEYNGKTYYVQRGGAIAVNKFIVIEGKAYITNENGEFKIGIAYDSPYYYYCDPTNGGAIKTDEGIVEFNGNKYFVLRGGAVATNRFIIVNGKAYMTGNSGEFRTGIVYDNKDKLYYYCDPADGGAIRTTEGDITWNGQKYHINKGGQVGTEIELKAAALAKSLNYSVYNAYKYLAKQPYYRMYVSTSYGKEWFASYGFTNAKGNCYVKTAMLYYMMKAMGYDNIRAVDGYCLGYGGERLPHGWIEYYSGGKTYIIDPTFENEVGRNGYMIEYGQKGTWKYLPNESRTWIE